MCISQAYFGFNSNKKQYERYKKLLKTNQEEVPKQSIKQMTKNGKSIGVFGSKKK